MLNKLRGEVAIMSIHTCTLFYVYLCFGEGQLGWESRGNLVSFSTLILYGLIIQTEILQIIRASCYLMWLMTLMNKNMLKHCSCTLEHFPKHHSSPCITCVAYQEFSFFICYTSSNF